MSQADGWGIAGLAVRKIGGRLLDGVVERHTGIEDVNLSGTIETVGTAVAPMIADAYSVKPNEGLIQRWERRLRWSLGIGVGLTAVIGVGWIAWRHLKKPEDVSDDAA